MPDNAPTRAIADSIAQRPALKYTTLTDYASLFEGANFPANTELTVYVGEKVVSLIGMFASATNLKKVKFVGKVDVCNISSVFASSSVEEVDFSGLETLCLPADATMAFDNCNNLVRILGEFDGEYNNIFWSFENCPKLEEVYFKKNSIVCEVSIPNSPNLTTKCIQSIVDGLSASATYILYLHSEVINRLTEKQKKEITDKGWSVV